MHCRWKNENIQIPHVNLNVFTTYLTVFTEITSYKPVFNFNKQEHFQAEDPFVSKQLAYVLDL